MGRLARCECGIMGREQAMGATHRLERSIVLGATSAIHYFKYTVGDPYRFVVEMGPEGRRRGMRRQ